MTDWAWRLSLLKVVFNGVKEGLVSTTAQCQSKQVLSYGTFSLQHTHIKETKKTGYTLFQWSTIVILLTISNFAMSAYSWTPNTTLMRVNSHVANLLVVRRMSKVDHWNYKV